MPESPEEKEHADPGKIEFETTDFEKVDLIADAGPPDADLGSIDNYKNVVDKDNADLGSIKNTLDKDNADLDSIKNKNTIDKDNADLDPIKNTIDKDNADLDPIKNTIDKDNADLDPIKNTLNKNPKQINVDKTLDKDNADLDSIKNIGDKDNADLDPIKNTLNKNANQINVDKTLKDNANIINQKNTVDKDNADLPGTPPTTTPSTSGIASPGAAAPQAPGFLSRAWSQVKDYASRAKDYASRAYDTVSNAASSLAARFSSSAAPPQTAPPPTVAPATTHPAIQKDGLSQAQSLAAGQQVGVQMGADEAHLMPKGIGLQTGGKLESIEHAGDKATVHYKAGSHEQVLRIDEKSPDGKALAEALDHIKAGDQMSIKIGRDENRKESIEINDKTSGFNAIVHDGKAEENKQIPQKTRGLDVNR